MYKDYVCKLNGYGEQSFKIKMILKVIIYSYLILKKMNERITDS